MYLILTIRSNVVDETVLLNDRDIAEKHFLDTCSTSISNWDEYTADDIEAVLDNGYVEKIDGSVCFLDLTGLESK